MQLPRTTRRGTALGFGFAVAAILSALLSGGTSASQAVSPQVCSGTLKSPGVLAGTYPSGVIVRGVCDVNAGLATVDGNITVEPGASLLAAFGLDDLTQQGSSSLVV